MTFLVCETIFSKTDKYFSVFYFCMNLPKDGTKPLDKDEFD